MKRKQFLLIPTFVVMIAMSLTACSDKTDVTENVPNELASSLTGNWYGEYTATSSTDGNYIKTVQGLQFNADGTGTCTQVECNVASEPLSIFGGTMDKTNGRFHYSSKADGTIVITRDGEGDKTHPKTWTMTLADSVLCGMDGTTSFQLKTAEDYQLSFLSQWEEILRSGGNSEKNTRSFLTDWPRCETVWINGVKEPQYLPWAGNSSAKSDIPEDIVMDINPQKGWEMAFCALSDPSSEKTRYFGLYHRYNGILRIYMYIPDAQAYGKEMAFTVSAGKNGKNRYPLYQTMEYSLASDKNYKDFNTDVILSTGTSKYSPFSWTQTPYTEQIEAKGVAAYWHCFDIDMSGYCPEGMVSWRDQVEGNYELLSIIPISQNTSDIKLAGSLIGDLKGKFDSKYKPQSAPTSPTLHKIAVIAKSVAPLLSSFPLLANSCYGIASHFTAPDGGGGGGGAAPNNDNDLPAQASRRASLTPKGAWGGSFALGYAGLVINSVGACLQLADGTEQSATTTGNIDLHLNAELDLTGTLKEWKSLSDGGLKITPNLLKKTNPNCNIGEGCFGLASAPVVYVSKEDMLSNRETVNMTKEVVDNKTYYTSPDSIKDLRFVYFLDPSSVKLNINTSLYKNVRNVQISSFCAVDANRPVGNTDSYRELTKMNSRPLLDWGDKKVIRLGLLTSPVRLTILDKDELFKDNTMCYPKFKDEEMNKLLAPKLIKQTGDVTYRYYGTYMEGPGSKWAIDPQIFLPFSNKRYFTPYFPDLVVSVKVTFDCDQMKGVTLFKRFIPEIKQISHADLSAKLTALKDYSNKSKNKQSVGTIANAPTIQVGDSLGHYYMQQSIKMLETVTKN